MLIVGPGDTTLDLRFDLGQFDPRITLTRASVATHFDSRGNLVVVQANEPRIDYDLKSGFCRGLLVESARTNLLLQSAVLATQAVNVTAVPHTLSCYGTGTVTLSGASTDGPLVGTGEQDRVSLTFTPSAAALTLTVAGDVRLAQLEIGAFPSSYIPTTTVAGTRAADRPTLPASDVLADIGTWYGECSTLPGSAGLQARRTVVGCGDEQGGWPLYLLPAGGTDYHSAIYDGTTEKLDGVAFTPIGGAAIRLASAYGGSSTAITRGGAAPSEGVFDGDLNIGATIGLGVRPSGGSSIYGHLRRLVYWPFRLPNGRLQEMTGPIGRVI